MEKLSAQFIDYGIATLALSGESQSGDQCLVQPFAEGVLVAVVDGLGHGAGAAEAACIAVQTLREHASESVIALARRCHNALKHSRGAVMSLASFKAADSSVTWMGIGNVGGVFLRADSRGLREQEVLLMRSGVVGSTLPELRASVTTVSEGDTLIFATDGIAEGFYDEISISDSPQKIADRILGDHNKGIDDAMVLVARFLTEES
jgi:serine/threonine protein phosphatase PrpC